MIISELLESLMLALFATSWFWLLRQVWRERGGRGMPVTVPLMVTAGCLFGLASKLAIYAMTGFVSFLVLIYAWTAVLSLAHLFLIMKAPYPEEPGPESPAG